LFLPDEQLRLSSGAFADAFAPLIGSAHDLPGWYSIFAASSYSFSSAKDDIAQQDA
jgi:hypothetical protein